MTKLNNEQQTIVLRLQALASCFNEYLDYYMPLYYDSLELSVSTLPRVKKREEIAKGKKEFINLKRMVNGFARVMETQLPEKHDYAINLICDTLDKIKLDEKD